MSRVRRYEGVQKVRGLIMIDIMNFIEIVSQVSTVCRYNIALLIIILHFAM